MSGRILRPESHDDLLGDFATGITGAHQWLEANIGDTEFPIAWLRNNSADYYCVKAQSLHTRKHNVNLDSIHVHYILQTASTAGQTIVYDLYYTWLTVGSPVPAIANWNKALGVVQTLGTQVARDYGIFSVVQNIAPPNPEGYGSTLLWRLVRGNGTYTGNLGIIASDAHMIVDRDGSKYELSDTL